MQFRILILFVLAFLFANQASAITTHYSLGYGQGGTKLSDVTGGQGYNTHAGSGLFLIGGVILPISPTIPHRYEFSLGVGYLFQDDARNEKNTVSWSRIPIEAIYFYRNTRDLYRFGWGLTYHVRNRISAKGTYSSATTSVDNALGWVITAEKMFTSEEQRIGTWGFGLKYVMIDYKSSSFSKVAEGDCLFLTLSSVVP